MAEASFPLPNDVTDDERRALRDGVGRHTQVTGEDARAFRLAAEQIGQTGPVHHFQYIRLYRVQNGYLAIGHDLREGMKVAFAERPEQLPAMFEPDTVREFVEDELRFRNILKTGAGAQ